MENWISATPTQGSKKGRVNVTVNSFKDTRKGKITVLGKSITKIVDVSQNLLTITQISSENLSEKPELNKEIKNGDTLEFIYRNWNPNNRFSLILYFSLTMTNVSCTKEQVAGLTFYSTFSIDPYEKHIWSRSTNSAKDPTRNSGTKIVCKFNDINLSFNIILKFL